MRSRATRQMAVTNRTAPMRWTLVFTITLVAVIRIGSALFAAERDPELIRRENAKAGSRDWQLTRVALHSTTGVRANYIEGYCSRQSVAAGEEIDIMVSTNPPSK